MNHNKTFLQKSIVVRVYSLTSSFTFDKKIMFPFSIEESPLFVPELSRKLTFDPKTFVWSKNDPWTLEKVHIPYDPMKTVTCTAPFLHPFKVDWLVVPDILSEQACQHESTTRSLGRVRRWGMSPPSVATTLNLTSGCASREVWRCKRAGDAGELTRGRIRQGRGLCKSRAMWISRMRVEWGTTGAQKF